MSTLTVEDVDEQTMMMLRKAFASAEKGKSGFIATAEMEEVLGSLGTTFDSDDLLEAIQKVDNKKTGQVNFDGFVSIVGAFLEDEEDDAVVIEELKEAFRLYDKKGDGYISTKVLREILRELDNKLTEQDLNDIISDIDEDDKGKIDFEGFKGLML